MIIMNLLIAAFALGLGAKMEDSKLCAQKKLVDPKICVAKK